ncbi:HK97 family phage prohead protease [Paraburkholderia sp. CNPSo 3076]|uniref:HK97 family phage prohead protease n=1 Tax=Paraburkholderia sp. CNPSo 3076 TaxID=2940936 RepID=UPI0022518917|nr:HK97 family phage prohead protease [Paraburkholderia sp. CNPSo 3076]MCX5538351.1 HK97 family phage prohead protease [Paraburkholderia sp. CNPSo 3076]
MEKLFSKIVVKTISEEKREIEGIASTPTVDRVNDIVDPMGLTFQKEVPLLLGHDHAQPVGTVAFGTPTARGLPFRARIAKVDEEGAVKKRTDEAWHSVKSGVIKGVSIGFRPSKSEKLPNGGTRFSKADVHELSLVAVPANPDARITSYKSLNFSQGNNMNQAGLNQVRKALAMSPMEAAIKSAVAPATTGNTPDLFYPSQQSGVTMLQPVVTRSVIAQLIDLGAPQLPPNVRALTQPANLVAPEVAEGAPVPAQAPSTEVKLEAFRKVGLITIVNSELVALGTDEVMGYLDTNLENAANNGMDEIVTGELLTLAGTPKTTVNAAFQAFTGDSRTACWIGNPEYLATLRSAQENEVGPNGGRYYQLPVLPALAMPFGTLLLVDAKRVAVYDGPRAIDRSTEADITMSSAPGTEEAQVYHLFQQNGVGLKVTKYFDYAVMTNPVAVSI